MFLSSLLIRIANRITILRDYLQFHKRYFPNTNKFGAIGNNTMIQYPFHAESPESVFIEDNTRIRNNINVVNAPNEKVYIKKYTAIGTGTLIIPGNHQSVVGIPHFLLGLTHINDKPKDIIIGEDCWIGANVIILSGAVIGRGAIVAAGTIVNKPIPPYAVVVGSPAKIIAKKFEIDDIIEHEKILYKPEERMTRKELERIFTEHFEGKKTFGIKKELTEEEYSRINEIKNWVGFVEPF